MASIIARIRLPVALVFASLPSFACSGCSDPASPVPVPVLICTNPAEMGPTAVGETQTINVDCTVGARSGVEIAAANVSAPFSAKAPGGTWRSSGILPITVTFEPVAAGTFEGQVVIAFHVGRDQGEESFLVRGVAVGDTSWDPDPKPPPCRAEGEAPLLDEALELAGLNRGNFTMANLSNVPRLYLDDFLLSWFWDVRAAPARAGCFEGEVAGVLDAHLESPHPVSGAIRQAAALLDRPVDGPAMTASAGLVGFETAIERLCNGLAGPCGDPTGEVPAELARALAPVLIAIDEGLTARASMALGDRQGSAFWYRAGGNHVLGGTEVPIPWRNDDRTYLLGKTGRRALYAAAARIAYAVETAGLADWAGAIGVRFDLETSAGWIRLRDAADDVYEDDGTATLLLLDTGGNDLHLDPAGSNRDENNPVSLLVDLAGDDLYLYEAIPDPDDPPGFPSDAEGRATGASGQIGATLSTRSRQGAARNGIAMLFDLGGGRDRYESLVASQGYAHEGVGVLFDDGGDDVYLAEVASQGAGVYGIGLLLDAGVGNDTRRSITYSQGFGYVAGVGFLFDGGGDDEYVCDPGPAGGGLLFYPSEQMPDGNRSFCQGAGLGMRDPGKGAYLSGGIGILRDMNGQDTYTASVFAQGTGYWQGTGVLSDGGGNDQYDAFWFAQGAAARFAVGILADAGAGDDLFDIPFSTSNASLGAGHDLSLGVLISEGGNDKYHLGPLSGGASSCNGVGLFVDNDGDDHYVASSDYGSGMADIAGESVDVCDPLVADRQGLPAIGIMIDGGGTDLYEYLPSAHPVPADGQSWGYAFSDLPTEHGAGIDGMGETGIHAESATP